MSIDPSIFSLPESELTTPPSPELRAAVSRTHEAYQSLQKARADLKAYEDTIAERAADGADYHPGIYYMQGYLALSGSVAIAFSDYAVARGEVVRLRKL